MQDSHPDRVVTRFAPSPTGFLHIGGARTALFNWLFARHHGGRFLLRIEDTDRARSTPEATRAIIEGLDWLGLAWDGEPISQFARADRHREVAEELLARGLAYKCFTPPEEVQAAREKARAEGRKVLFESPWRDVPASEHPDAPFVVRLKAPRTGETVIEDKVQGTVRWRNDQLDDMVLLRSDGTPTYMLAVVVDDHDMGVTHIIRGDDHLANAARQKLIYDAMGWEVPVFAHIPLIHGPDGKKLSKRHGALGIEEYRKMGYLPEALRNYLARLGWSHGDQEFFTTDELVALFDLDGINKAPARLDFRKLDHISGLHIAAASPARLMEAIDDWLAATGRPPIPQEKRPLLEAALPLLQGRAKTVGDLVEGARFALLEPPVVMDTKAAKAWNSVSHGILKRLTLQLQNASWERDRLEALVRETAEREGLRMGALAQALRAALAGTNTGPSVFDMMMVLGREETLERLEQALAAGEDNAAPAG